VARYPMTDRAPQAPGFSHGVEGRWRRSRQSTPVIHPLRMMGKVLKPAYRSGHNVVYVESQKVA